MRAKSTLDVELQKSDPALSFRHIGLLILLMVCAFLVVGQVYLAIPLVEDIAARFDVPPAQAALAGSAFSLAYAAGFLMFGPLLDRLGRRRALLIGLTAMAPMTLLVGLAQSFGLLLAARAFQGMAASVFPPVALALVAEEAPPAHRLLGVSLMSFTFLSAAPLAQFFAARAGALPTIMLALAPLYFVGAAGLFFVAKAAPIPGAVGPRVWRGGLFSGAFFQDPVLCTAWAAAIPLLFAFVLFHGGVQALGVKIDVDPQGLRLIGLPPLLLTFAAAPLTRRKGARMTARVGLLLAALGLLLANIGSSLALTIASLLLSAGLAFAVPGLIATIVGRATSANRGLALAIYSFCLFLGASLAPPITQGIASPLLLGLLTVALLSLAALSLPLVPRTAPN